MGITEESLKSLAATAEGVPVYLDETPSVIDDPSRDRDLRHWQAACELTTKLTRSLEAARDTAYIIKSLADSPTLTSDKRQFKPLIVPVFNFATTIQALYNEVERWHWSRLKVPEQRRLKLDKQNFGKQVSTASGSLKIARDKISAHLDTKIETSEYRQVWESFTIPDVLKWVRGCVRMMLSLLDADLYSWTRPSRRKGILNLMNVDGTEVSLLVEGDKLTRIVDIQFVTSPKYGVFKEIEELSLLNSKIAERLDICEGNVWKAQNHPTSNPD